MSLSRGDNDPRTGADAAPASASERAPRAGRPTLVGLRLHRCGSRAVLGAALIAALCGVGRCGAEPVTLTLRHCLDTALQNNRELIQAREAVRQVEGSAVVVRSRFLPHVDVTATYDGERLGRTDATEDETGSRLQLTQRLFEYGPDFAQEVQAREDLRKAVYAYEGSVREVLASVWQNYHLILLQDQQMAIRRQSRAGFEALYEQQTRRYEARMSTESDVLQAYLNVLNDSLAINDLERQQFNNKMTLLRLIAEPIGTAIVLTADTLDFALDQEKAVKAALANSVEIALAGERLKEQERVVGELAWLYAPDLVSLAAGVEDGRRSAAVNVAKDNKTWGVDLASEYALQDKADAGPRNGARWFLQLETRIPLFDGTERLGRETTERARLRELRASLRDLEAGAELQVRQAFQSVLEADGRQRIQVERARIAGKRLEITQILKDKGQADETLLENFRQQFFEAQDRLFEYQATYIQRQAALRRQMGYFE